MKTTFTYDHYFKYAEVKSNLEYFSKTYPQLCQVTSIYTTPQGRDVFAVTLSSGNPSDKPAYYIDGNTHAGEVTGSMAAMHTLDYLLTNYQTDLKVREILEKFTIYIIPRISPDGAEVYLTTADSLRSVDRPYLSEKQENGLYAKDIDNNGVIAMMRFKSPSGVWMIDPKNPLLMKKRTPDQMDGEFYHVYTEGMIEGDIDPIYPARPLWGLDFNRNYPFGWFTENRQPGAGPYPLSNPETKAVVDFVINHPNIGGVATLHTSGGIILYPPGTKPAKSAPLKDVTFFKEIGAMGTEEMGYGCINIFDSFFPDQTEFSSGAFDDWCYQSRGILAYTIELWNLEERAGCGAQWPVPTEPKTVQERMDDLGKVYEWVQKHCPEAILPWKKFDHPQLGEVEIGGLSSKFTYQNCPTEFLLQELEKTTRFTLRMACTLPRLEISKKEVTHLEGNLYKVVITIANCGYLPTYLTDALCELGLDHDVKLTIDGDLTVINGAKEVNLGNLEGFGCITSGFSYGPHIHTSAYKPLEKKVSYVISCQPNTKISIQATGAKTGTITEELVIE